MIDVGRATIDSFMQRVLQLKHPQHFTAVTMNTAQLSAVLVVLVDPEGVDRGNEDTYGRGAEGAEVERRMRRGG